MRVLLVASRSCAIFPFLSPQKIRIGKKRRFCYTYNEMRTFEQHFTVSYQYPVIFCRDLFAEGCEALSRVLSREAQERVLVVLDRGLEEAQPDLPEKITKWMMAHGNLLSFAAPIERIPGGEYAKKHDVAVSKLIKLAYQTHLSRKDIILAIGGGAVQDAVGYAASMIHRGTRLVRVNSTTLAQADGGVSVKNGIDYASGKNFIGTFAVPYAVFNDTALLTTLSERDWRNGVAEAVKAAVIKDADFLQWIQAHADALRMRDLEVMETLLERSAELHLQHIAYGGDPFEEGRVHSLDFGHWSAHRLESLTCWQLSHGEAVGVGIALDMLYAARLGCVSDLEATSVIRTLQACGLRVWCDELILRGGDGRLALLEGVHQFREHLGGRLSVTLPKGIGQCSEVHEIQEVLLESAVQTLRERFA